MRKVMTKNLYKSTYLVLIALISSLSSYAIDKLPDYKKDVLPILQSHCMKCHGKDKQKGKVRFDTLSTDFINDSQAAETWDEASNSIKLGEMPPEEAKKQLSAQQRRILTRWIDGSLLKAANAGAGYTAGVMRQMNKAEYQYTMEDLLGYKMNYAEDVPADLLSPDGFRNNGASQGMTGQHIETFMKTAHKALDFILVEGPQPKRIAHKFPQASTGLQNSKEFRPGFSYHILGRNTTWGGIFMNLGTKKEPIKMQRSGPFTIRVKARLHKKIAGQADPILRVRYGFNNNIMYVDTVGTVDIDSEKSKVYEFRGEASKFPMPETVDKRYKNTVVLLDNILDDGSRPEKKKSNNKKGDTKKIVTLKSDLDNIMGTRKRNLGKFPLPPADPGFPKILVESVEIIYHDYPSWPPPVHQQIIPKGKNLSSDSDLMPLSIDFSCVFHACLQSK